MAIYFVYDKTDSFSNKIVDTAYQHFSYDYSNYFSSDLGLSIYLYSIDDFISANTANFCKNDLTIILITPAFFEKTKAFKSQYDRFNKAGLRLLPVSLCKNGHLLLDEINVLVVALPSEIDSKDQVALKEEIIIYRILCIIAQKFIQKKITIFLSYYREEGTDICHKIRDYLIDYPEYVEWMDVKQIDFSSKIQSEIAKCITHSAMMCISTDKYSERYWCTMEILNAKKADIPMIVIDSLQTHENRRNPISGNLPVVRIQRPVQRKDVAYALLILMKEYMRHMLFAKTKRKDTYFLWHAPEPSKIAEIKRKHPAVNRIAYPAPPISLCEANYYHSLFNDCNIVLNNELFNNENKHSPKTVMLSVSDCPIGNSLHPSFLNCLVKEIIRYLIYKKYNIIYGGDWRAKGYTQLIHDYMRAYQNQYINSKSRLINYYANVEQKDENEIRHNAYPGKVVFFNLKPTEIEENSIGTTLTEMRRKMVSKADIIIAVGGQMQSAKGFISGVAEEISLAIENRKPFYLIGAPGGATKRIIEIITEHKEEFSTNKTTELAIATCRKVNAQLNSYSIEKLSRLNHLKKKNQILFDSSDIMTIVTTLFSGIEQI